MSVSITNREQAEALIQEQISKTIFQDAPKQSIVLQMARKLPNKSNTHRIDKLEELAEAIHEQGKTLAVMCSQLQAQGDTLEKQGKRLEQLEKKPSDLWDKVVAAAISAIVGGVIGAVIAALAI